MLLLDRISDYGPDWVEARLKIRRDTVFAEPHGVPSWVGVEIMAQTASAFSGILQQQTGEPTTIALLLGSRRYRAYVPFFAFDCELRVLARQSMLEPGGLAAFDCTIVDANNGTELATAQIKAFRPPDIERFLEDNP